MTANFEVIDGKLRVAFWYQGDTDKVQAILEDAAEYLWEHGFGDHGTEEEPLLFEDLTNQEKLDFVDLHVRRVIINLANSWKSAEAQRIVREVEAADPHEFD